MKKLNFTLMMLILLLLLAGCGGQVAGSPQPVNAASISPPVAAPDTPHPAPIPKFAAAEAQADSHTPAAVHIEGEPAALHTDGSTRPQQAQPAVASLSGDAVDPPTVCSAQAIVSVVKVRQGPGPGFAKLGALQLGQVVDVLGFNPQQDWAQIRSGQLTGWVSLDYLDLMGNRSQESGGRCQQAGGRG